MAPLVADVELKALAGAGEGRQRAGGEARGVAAPRGRARWVAFPRA
jgi:hypothetical protein